jgi:3-(3-hydroxy-phenyl)propionate hydroxylase
LRHFLSHDGCAIRFGQRVTDAAALDSEWVIGADGAHSAVRHSMGIDFVGITYPERYLVASTLEELTGLSYVNYVADPQEWLVLLRTPDHWRVLLPTESDSSDAEELAKLGARLRDVHDFGRPWRVAHASIYRVHQRVAATFLKDNVLLAGDAAHVNNPLGGLGMNSGIHDAIAYARAFPHVAGAAAEQRKIAIEVIQRNSHHNRERVRDPESHLARMKEIAADPVRARAYLLRTSMLRAGDD